MQAPADGQKVTVCDRGQQLIELLQDHILRFAKRVQTAGAAAEECEREVEQEQEVEREIELEKPPLLKVARIERNWCDWEAALQCKTIEEFMQAANTTVRF